MRWRGDDLVDELIAQNAAKPRPGMEKADLTLLAKVGQMRWSETVQAQHRQRPDLAAHESPGEGHEAKP